MKASPSITSKIANGFRFLNARPHLFIPPNVRNALQAVATGGIFSPEDARDVLEWYGEQSDLPQDIADQLTGKEQGRAWLKQLAKKAAPKLTPEKLTKDFQKKIEKAINEPSKKETVYINSVGVGASGRDGWTPVFALYSDSGQVYQRILDWAGGKGEKPPVGYLGETGVVSSLNDATNVRGPAGDGGSGGKYEVTLVGTHYTIFAIQHELDLPSTLSVFNSQGVKVSVAYRIALNKDVIIESNLPLDGLTAILE